MKLIDTDCEYVKGVGQAWDRAPTPR